jgi:integrase/recombinase XerD
VVSLEEPVRDLDAIRLPEWGRVVEVRDVVPWRVEDDTGCPVRPVQRYLRDLVARGKTPGTVRSYAFVLLRWWRFLRAIDVRWDRATSAETRDFALWFQRAGKPGADRRTVSARTAGTINPVTRKQYLDDSYKPATVRHSNAVLRSFYGFWIEQGLGPVVNPVPQDRVRGRRPNAHHNPLEPFRPEGRLRYNPPLPRRRPRAMPDELWDGLFAAMPSDRDRAILALDVSTGARAAELLGIRGADVDWGDQLIRVRRKGTGAQQWLPASPEAFVWLRLYVAETGDPGGSGPVWRTLRQRCGRDGGELQWQPLTYDAWRAVLRRANARLGTNWSMHDLRHTCAVRMIRGQNLSLRDVQVILGHAHLTTTQIYLEEDDHEVIARVREHLAGREERAKAAPPLVAAGYDAGDLAVLFGGGQ